MCNCTNGLLPGRDGISCIGKNITTSALIRCSLLSRVCKRIVRYYVFFFFSKDIDECATQPRICGYGECYNTIGSFNCRCEEGYSVKPAEGPACTDDDECRLNAYSCSEFAECQNTQGSYVCTCHEGFTGNGIECWDINECSTNNGGCDSNAHCINTEGSFKVSRSAANS